MGIRYLNHQAVIQCVHGGTVQLVPPASRSMRVEGSPVLTDQDLRAALIVGCPQMGPGLKPCLKITSIITGLSQDIQVDGQTPILQTLKAMTDGVAPGIVSAMSDGRSNAVIFAPAAASVPEPALSVDGLSWWQRLLQSQLVQGAIGLFHGVVQGFTPLGSLLPSPAPHVRAFEFFRGVGEFLAGITQIGIGAGGEVIGVALDVTGVGAVVGLPINVASAAIVANGVVAAGAGIATMTHALSMADQPSGSGTGTTGPTRVHANETMPTGKKGGEPTGRRTEVRKGTDKRSDELENESADVLSKEGYQVQQNPGRKPNGREPDYKIEGEWADNYAPSKTKSPKGIADEVGKKAGKGQADRVVVNMKDADAPLSDVRQSMRDLHNTPGNGMQDVKEVIVIDKNGQVTKLYPPDF